LLSSIVQNVPVLIDDAVEETRSPMYNDNHSNYKLYYPDFSSYLYRYVHELEDAAEPKQPEDFDQIYIAK